jgi:hypothetical protein
MAYGNSGKYDTIAICRVSIHKEVRNGIVIAWSCR